MDTEKQEPTHAEQAQQPQQQTITPAQAKVLEEALTPTFQEYQSLQERMEYLNQQNIQLQKQAADIPKRAAWWTGGGGVGGGVLGYALSRPLNRGWRIAVPILSVLTAAAVTMVYTMRRLTRPLAVKNQALQNEAQQVAERMQELENDVQRIGMEVLLKDKDKHHQQQHEQEPVREDTLSGKTTEDKIETSRSEPTRKVEPSPSVVQRIAAEGQRSFQDMATDKAVLQR